MEPKEIFKDALPILEKSAPIITKIIAGHPLGAAVDIVIHLLRKYFGKDVYTDTLAKTIVNDPEATPKLQQLEKEHYDLLIQLCKDHEHDHKCVTVNINVDKGGS
jgi:hypothetical protein